MSVLEDYQNGIDPVTPFKGSDIAPVKSVEVVTGEPASSDWTPWMNDEEFAKFLVQLRGTKGHPTAYWGKGHWINAVEGRWHNGEEQFRITYGPKPKHKKLWWLWYFGLTQAEFNGMVGARAADGFTLLDGNFFTYPDGSRHYQGVWHKVIAPDVVEAAAFRRSK